MSGWWDTTALASIASSAVKAATKKIDKVLDIQEGAAGSGTANLVDQSGESTLSPNQNSEPNLYVSTSNEDTGLSTPRSLDEQISSPQSPGNLGAVKLVPFEPSTEYQEDVNVPEPNTSSNFSLPTDSEVHDLTENSSSLMVPIHNDTNGEKIHETSSNTAFPDQVSIASSELSNTTPQATNMASSSEDTVQDDHQKNEGSTSPRSIESPAPPSEAPSSSCMGSELIRVEVAPSTCSDIEIVSTPSSCIVEGYTTVSSNPSIDSSRHFRPLVPANVVDSESSPSQPRKQISETQNMSKQQQQNDQTAAQLMRQLAEITRALEKKDGRMLELSDENTVLHNQLTEIRRQMDAQATQEAQFGADTVRLLKNEIKDRDQIIYELREEGEKLSKHQAQSTALIRKLRAKEKEFDSQLSETQQKNEELQSKLVLLERNLTLKMEGERQSGEMVQQMSFAVKRMEKELQEKDQNISDLKADIEAMELRVSSQGDSSKERENKLLERIDQLGELVRELEDRTLYGERHRRQEVAELEAKLEQANSYAELLREDASSATRPVVKQLETLQQSYAMASKSWNDTEKSMANKIAQLEQNWASADQKARQAELSATANGKRSVELEKHVDVLKTELTRVQANCVQLEADRDLWKRRVSNLETMCEQERARAAGFERRATESESRLSLSSSSNQRRCHELEGQLTKIENEHDSLKIRYDNLLEMYGEKAEEAEELRNDVAELRQVFRDHFASYNSPDSNTNGADNTSPNGEVR